MQSSKDFLLKVHNKIQQKGIIDQEIIDYIDAIFLNNSSKVLEVISRGITKVIYKPSNRVIWTVKGENKFIKIRESNRERALAMLSSIEGISKSAAESLMQKFEDKIRDIGKIDDPEKLMEAERIGKKKAKKLIKEFRNEYLIYPKLYCSCHSYYNNVVIEGSRRFCKHMLAQVICESLNKYDERILEDNEFKEVIIDSKLKT